MSPIEQAARALCIADGDKPDRDFTSGNVTFPCWKSYQSRARAVLQAIREPSEGMLKGEAMDAYEGAFERPETAEQHMTWIWQSMINCALSE